MHRMAAFVAVLAVGVTVAYAQNLDAIKQRQGVMDTIARAADANFKMMKGQAPFDLSQAQSRLKLYQDEAAKLKGLFPDDSKTGGDTDASPKIWQAKAEFEAAVDKFIAGVKTAASAIKDEATFKAEYRKVAESCGGCHKKDGGFAPSLADSFKKLKQ
jgi:cytochrome c556